MLTNEQKCEAEEYMQDILCEWNSDGVKPTEYQKFQFFDALSGLVCGSFAIACVSVNAIFATNVPANPWPRPGSKPIWLAEITLDDLQQALTAVKQSPVQEHLVRYV